MNRRVAWGVGLTGVLLAGSWSFAGRDSASDDKPKPSARAEADKAEDKKTALQAFMRKKLGASQKVLEGLTAEDFDLIAEGAKELKKTSAAADFMVHNDMSYKEHADDFRRIVQKLDKAADELRLDGALLAYVDMTMSCVECHKYVKHVLIAER